jgi:hypothetical protein
LIIKPANNPVNNLPNGNAIPVIILPFENPNSKAATNQPTAPVNAPAIGPPIRAVMNVARWLKSKANPIVTGPRGIDGAMGVS